MDATKLVEFLGGMIDDATVEPYDRLDTNGIELHGVMIRRNDDPSIGMVTYYDDEKEGVEFEVAMKIAASYREQIENGTPKQFADMAAGIMEDKEKFLDAAIICVMNKERNVERLADMVHEDFLDLSIAYRLRLGDSATALIAEKALDKLGITVEELKTRAKANLIAMANYENISARISEITGMDVPEAPLEVISTKDEYLGSGLIACPEFLSQLGDGFYVLPSSIHEILKVKPELFGDVEDEADEAEVVERLKRMVHEVNESVVEETDFLSDSVYLFKDGKLEVA